MNEVIWTPAHAQLAAHRGGFYLGSVSRFASSGVYVASRSGAVHGEERQEFTNQDEAKAWLADNVVAGQDIVDILTSAPCACDWRRRDGYSAIRFGRWCETCRNVEIARKQYEAQG